MSRILQLGVMLINAVPNRIMDMFSDFYVERPCKEICRKCGSNDINRQFIRTGENFTKSFGFNANAHVANMKKEFPGLVGDAYNFGTQNRYDIEAKCDIVKHHCRVCSYNWVGLPYDV